VKLERGMLQAHATWECPAKSCYRLAKGTPESVRSERPSVLPNMFNRGAMHVEEACDLALIYPVVAEQEEFLSLFD